MKLLTHYNRIVLPLTISVLILSSVVLYFIIRSVLIDQLDKDLVVEEREILDYVKKNNVLPQISSFPDQQILFSTAAAGNAERKFSTIRKRGEDQTELEPYRQLVFPLTFNREYYKAQVLKSQEASEDLLALIASLTACILGILLAAIYLVNRYILAKIWKPFYRSLTNLKNFDAYAEHGTSLPDTEIDEFRELNQTSEKLMSRVSTDFHTLKAFTENASHEIQTPLAVIKMKAEILLQSPVIGKAEHESLYFISDAADRLSRLNQSLLLLTRLDNRQGTSNENIDMTEIVSRQLTNLAELADARNLKLETRLAQKVHLALDKALAETLVANLLSNAVKHNIPNGRIDVHLAQEKFIVSNTGAPPGADPQTFFDRFTKGDPAADSLGLGLAIVKKICDTYDFGISYTFRSEIHIISVAFRTSLP